MSEARFTDGPWVACVSSNDDGDICTAIKDKGNGNCIVANEIDEDYECLLLTVPDMYEELDLILNSSHLNGDGTANVDVVKLKALLAKARG